MDKTIEKCRIAKNCTNGDWECTRNAGHEGPCAARPIYHNNGGGCAIGMKEIFVEWEEPFGPAGEPVFSRTSIRTAIAYQCWKREQNGLFKYKSDEDALKDFLTDHWAQIILIPEKSS